MPVQSDSIPLFNVYFTLCIIFSLCSLFWFSLANNLRERKNLPKCLYMFISLDKKNLDKPEHTFGNAFFKNFFK